MMGEFAGIFDDLYSENSILSRSAADIVAAARWLHSERGGNPEYDRALVDMVCDLLGFGFDLHAQVAAALGFRSREGLDDGP